MIYVMIVAIANVLIIAFNFALGVPTADAVFAPLLSTAAVVAIDGLTAFLIRRALPERMFAPENRFFNIKKAEKRFFRFIRVTSWADKIPELGGFTGFRKDRLDDRRSKEYLGRFLLEANYGRVIHAVNGICGFAILFIPFAGRLSAALPVALVNLFLSILPILVLKDNSYSLKRMYDRME